MTRRLRALVVRIAALFHGTGAGRDFDAELESHLQHHIDDNLQAGMTPAQARRERIRLSRAVS